MKIAFVTTQTLSGSTVAGRILPLGKELKKQHQVLTYVMQGQDSGGADVKIVGQEPFERTANGKIRLRGLSLVIRLLKNTFQTFEQLIQDKPEIIVIVKPLPQNTLAVALARWLYSPKKIILDCDDFELTANVLTSLTQRGVIHASERLACKISQAAIVATPFLQDHIRYLTNNKKPVHLMPTGLTLASANLSSGEKNLVYAGSISISSGHRVDMLPQILKALHGTYPQLTLHLAGTGDDTQKIKDKAIQEGVASQLKWHGRFSESSLLKMMNQQTILLDPIDSSVVARAKSSFRCMVALQTGLPVITSSVGIRTQLLPTKLHERLLAKPGDVMDYVEKIKSLLANPLTDSDKTALKEASSKYTWQTLADIYLSAIHI